MVPASSVLSLENFRLRTASNFKVEASLSRPGARLAVCTYGWDAALPATPFRSEAHYLDLALTHRPPEVELAYLGRAHGTPFAASGDCCFVPAGHEMLVRCPEGEQRVLACLLEPDALRSFFDWEWTPLELAVCLDINNVQIRASLSRIAEELLAPGYATEVVVDAALATLMVDLHRHFHAIRHRADQRAGALSRRTLRLLENLVGTDEALRGGCPSVQQLAAQCGMSVRHLSRLFRRTTGRTLGSFVEEARLARAKRLLAERRGMIKEIAFECGFHSASAFAHAFKRATGSTPHEYRHARST